MTGDVLIDWAKATLNHEIINVTEIVTTPYSRVLKLQTAPGSFYLKQTPSAFFIEVRILNLLRSKCHAAVPDIIAANESLHCFITRASGDENLRKLFAGNLDAPLLLQGIAAYKSIQQASRAHIQEFLDIGVPDWRLDKMPARYAELIRDAAWLKSCGLADQQIVRLQTLAPSFAQRCERLAALGLPDALNHSDFQDGNMILDQKSDKITIIDWGEISIGNPLMPLLSCLGAVKTRYKIPVGGEDYKKLQGVFFDDFNLPQDGFQNIIAEADAVARIHYVLTIQNLMRGIGDDYPTGADKIKSALTGFLNQIEVNGADRGI